MSDPASGFGGVENFASEHKEAVVIGLGVLAVIIIYILFKPAAAAPQAASVPNDDTATEAAAAIQNAQVTANAQTSANTIAAGVTNNQTAAAQTVALATVQGQTQSAVAASSATAATAYYGAATEIAGANSALAIAQSADAVTEQTNQDSLLGSEFTNLAGVLNNYSNNATSLQKGLQGLATTQASAVGALPTLQGPVSPNTGEGIGLALSTGNAGIGILDEMNQNALAASTNAQINTNNTNLLNTATTLNTQNIAANAATLGSVTASASGAVATMSTWLQSLFGAFTQSQATSAPKITAPSATAISSLNLSPLAGGPALPSLAGLTAF